MRPIIGIMERNLEEIEFTANAKKFNANNIYDFQLQLATHTCNSI